MVNNDTLPALPCSNNQQTAAKRTTKGQQPLGVSTIEQLAEEKADELYVRLCRLTGTKQDPCVHDVFSATIYQAISGEALDWWQFTTARKIRQLDGNFPTIDGI